MSQGSPEVRVDLIGHGLVQGEALRPEGLCVLPDRGAVVDVVYRDHHVLTLYHLAGFRVQRGV
jgi:hypothetical protein